MRGTNLDFMSPVVGLVVVVIKIEIPRLGDVLWVP